MFYIQGTEKKDVFGKKKKYGYNTLIVTNMDGLVLDTSKTVADSMEVRHYSFLENFLTMILSFILRRELSNSLRVSTVVDMSVFFCENDNSDSEPAMDKFSDCVSEE